MTPELSNRAITNAVDNDLKPRHRWYPIKESFSADLISNSIKEFENGKRDSMYAIEPFSGSGTAPVQYALSGIPSVAYEVNPFLAFISKTKTLQVTPEEFGTVSEIVVKGLKRPQKLALEDYSTFCEGNGNTKWLFNRAVLRAFAGGWSATNKLAVRERDLCRLALIRATMDNCNATPDGKCLRYKRLESFDCFTAESVIDKFKFYVNLIQEDVERAPIHSARPTIICCDVRHILRKKHKRKFDLCVTSPPYLNSFDYSDVYRPEMFLAGLVSNNDDLMKIRLRTVRSHVQATWRAPIQTSFGVMYKKVFQELEQKQGKLWSPRLLIMVQAYFEDIQILLKSLKCHAKHNAIVKIAVGTSAYAGIVIPVDLIIAEIAEHLGWLLKDIKVVRRLRSSPQLWSHNDVDKVPELRESIILLNRTS
jgi:hypothetical protein